MLSCPQSLPTVRTIQPWGGKTFIQHHALGYRSLLSVNHFSWCYGSWNKGQSDQKPSSIRNSLFTLVRDNLKMLWNGKHCPRWCSMRSVQQTGGYIYKYMVHATLRWERWGWCFGSHMAAATPVSRRTWPEASAWENRVTGTLKKEMTNPLLNLKDHIQRSFVSATTSRYQNSHNQ